MGIIIQTTLWQDKTNNENTLVTTQELEAAITKLKIRKFPGSYLITNEMFKYGGETPSEEIITLYNKLRTSR